MKSSEIDFDNLPIYIIHCTNSQERRNIILSQIEKLGSKVIAVAVNTEDCSNEEAFAYQAAYAKKLNIPVLLPMQEGVDPLIPTLKALIK